MSIDHKVVRETTKGPCFSPQTTDSLAPSVTQQFASFFIPAFFRSYDEKKQETTFFSSPVASIVPTSRRSISSPFLNVLRFQRRPRRSAQRVVGSTMIRQGRTPSPNVRFRRLTERKVVGDLLLFVFFVSIRIDLKRKAKSKSLSTINSFEQRDEALSKRGTSRNRLSV